jgi:hypothetical protein
MKTLFFPTCFILLVLVIGSCKESEDPNSIGGTTDVPFAKVGDTTTIFAYLDELMPGVESPVVDFVVVENKNGIVISRGHFETDTAFTHKIDTLLGTATLPSQIKTALREKAIRAFNVQIDSSDKNNLKLDFSIKTKVTSEGLQDFVHSELDESKPFTLVKYNANVGDKYEFTDKDGNHFVREVTFRSTTDDYPLAFWLIKVIKVEETITEGPLKDLVGKITYYTNHKFGLVGVEWTKPDGKVLKITVFPSNL